MDPFQFEFHVGHYRRNRPQGQKYGSAADQRIPPARRVEDRAIHHNHQFGCEKLGFLDKVLQHGPNSFPIFRCPIETQFRLGFFAMSSIPAPVRQVLAAQNDATNQQINTALLRKGLDAQQQAGDAINALLEQTVELQKQFASGHIDVKV
jgi:hypothetical protein